MGFFEYLDNLREKPSKYRNKVSVLLAILLTVVIGGSWFMYKYAYNSAPEVVAVSEEAAGPIDSALSGFKNSFKDLGGVWDKFNDTVGSLFGASYKAEQLDFATDSPEF